MKRFTPKQLKFMDEYIISGNATQAAITAGYSPLTAQVIGAHNLSKDYIIKEIAFRQEILAGKLNIKKEFIIKKLVETIEKCEQANDKPNMLKALDMLNKMGGFYSSTVTNINIDVPLFPDVP